MENSLIVAAFSLLVAVAAGFWAAATLVWLHGRLKVLEAWVKEEEKAASEPDTTQEPAYKSPEYMRQLAQRSQAVQAERRAQEAAATQEVTAAIKAGGTDLEAIKASVSGVIAKYPQVAENAVKKAIRDLGYQRYEGVIMPLVAELAQRALAPKQAPAEEQMGSGW